MPQVRISPPTDAIVTALAAAWEVVDFGIVLLDAGLTVQAVNRAFTRMANLPPGLLESRPRFRDLVDHAVTNDLYDVPPNALPVYLRALDKEIRLGSAAPRRIKLKDGRRMIFRCTVAPHDWRILTYVDISRELRLASAEAAERAGVDARFNSETMESQATYLAALAEAAAESAERAEISRILLEKEIAERRQIEIKLRILATTDGLTGAFNRSESIAAAHRAFQDARQSRRDLTLVMVDVDHFKAINDCHGHAGGDHALRHLVDVLRAGLRDQDFVGRLGGEEFLIALPGVPPETAGSIAERLRRRVAESPLTFGDRSIALTVSMGAASLSSGDASAEAVILRADEALYRAKAAGRNRLELALHAEAA